METFATYSSDDGIYDDFAFSSTFELGIVPETSSKKAKNSKRKNKKTNTTKPVLRSRSPEDTVTRMLKKEIQQMQKEKEEAESSARDERERLQGITNQVRVLRGAPIFQNDAIEFAYLNKRKNAEKQRTIEPDSKMKDYYAVECNGIKEPTPVKPPACDTSKPTETTPVVPVEKPKPRPKRQNAMLVAMQKRGELDENFRKIVKNEEDTSKNDTNEKGSTPEPALSKTLPLKPAQPTPLDGANSHSNPAQPAKENDGKSSANDARSNSEHQMKKKTKRKKNRWAPVVNLGKSEDDVFISSYWSGSLGQSDEENKPFIPQYSNYYQFEVDQFPTIGKK